MNRIVILGAGESGAGAAVLAKKEGFDVFVSDMSKIADKYKKMLDDHQIEWEEGQHTAEKILNADEIIKSPGIPETAPMVRKAVEKGIHIISEIEFAHSSTISSSMQAMMRDWLVTSVTPWPCRSLRSRTNTISSNSVRSNSTTCMTSVPTSPSC